MEQQHNKGRLEGFMAELGRKLDLLIDKARQETEEAKVNERLEELKHTKDKLEKELHEFVQDDERWKEVQQRLQGAGQELKKAFEITFSRKKGSEHSSQGGYADAQANGNASATERPSTTQPEGYGNPGGDTTI